MQCRPWGATVPSASVIPSVAAQLIRGFLMGAADVVPGVSGGTVALVLGIYQRGEEIIDRIGQRPLPPDYGDIELDPHMQGGPDGLGIAANNAMEDTDSKIRGFFHAISGVPEPCVSRSWRSPQPAVISSRPGRRRRRKSSTARSRA